MVASGCDATAPGPGGSVIGFGECVGTVLPAEGFDAGLQELTGLAPAIAEHRPEIGEARGLPDTAGGKIVARHGNRQVRAQAQFLAAGIRGQVEAFADVLAGEVEERVGRLQNRRLGMNVAGLRKGLQQGIRPGGGGGRGYVHLGSKVPKTGSKRGFVAEALAWPRRGFDRDWPSGLIGNGQR